MGEFKETEQNFDFRAFPASPEDGEEFIIEADGKTVTAIWNATKQKWIKK